MSTSFCERTSPGRSFLWERPRLSYGDLPTLQTLLRACNAETLAEVLVACYGGATGWDKEARKHRAAQRKRVLGRVRHLREMGAVESREGWRMLFSQEAYTLDPVSLAISKYVRMELESVGAGTAPCLRALSEGEALACRVWLDPALCVRERYMALASAVWELSAPVRESSPSPCGFELGHVVGIEGMARAAEGEKDSSALRSEDEYGLYGSDPFQEDYLARLAETVAALNARAFRRYVVAQSSLAARLS